MFSEVFVGGKFVGGFNIEYWSAQLAQCGANSSITVWCIKKTYKNTAFGGENRGFGRKKRVRNVPHKINCSPCWVVFELFNVWTTQTTAHLTGPRVGYVKWTTVLGMSIWWKLKLPSKIAISADKHFFSAVCCIILTPICFLIQPKMWIWVVDWTIRNYPAFERGVSIHYPNVR